MVLCVCSQEEDINSNGVIREGCMKEVALEQVTNGHVRISRGPPIQGKQVAREMGDSTKLKVQEK